MNDSFEQLQSKMNLRSTLKTCLNELLLWKTHWTARLLLFHHIFIAIEVIWWVGAIQRWYLIGWLFVIIIHFVRLNRCQISISYLLGNDGSKCGLFCKGVGLRHSRSLLFNLNRIVIVKKFLQSNALEMVFN